MNPPEFKVNSIDILYEALDDMTEPDLKLLMKDIEEEIELRKYKATRVKKMKQELDKEFEILVKKQHEKFQNIIKKNAALEQSDDELTVKKPVLRQKQVKKAVVKK